MRVRAYSGFCSRPATPASFSSKTFFDDIASVQSTFLDCCRATPVSRRWYRCARVSCARIVRRSCSRSFRSSDGERYVPNGAADTVGSASWRRYHNLRHLKIERFVVGPQNLTPCTKRATEMFPEPWIVCWRALAAERLVWDRKLRPWVRLARARAASEMAGSELGVMLSGAMPLRRER